jgi:hypothetical protein
MAKSLFEPKKITRYANNQALIEGGLAGNAIPPRQVSATRAVPKTDSIPADASNVGSSNTPVDFGGSTGDSNPPPPVVVGETRAFSFDGATELTGSFPSAGGNKLKKGIVYATVNPGWSSEETGSFTLYSVSNPSDANDYRRHITFERTSGSNGYEDRFIFELSSGSNYDKFTWPNPLSPNFYSGSSTVGDGVFFQFAFNGGYHGSIKVKNDWIGLTGNSNVERDRTDVSNSITAIVANQDLSNGDYKISIGGQASGSSSYFKGEVLNFAIAKGNSEYYSDHLPLAVNDGQKPQLIYRFEGTTDAIKGDHSLDVVGTETFVSASI